MITVLSESQLLAMHTGAPPPRRGKAYAVVMPSGIPIWALIGALPAAENEPREVARAYDISEAETEAALAYYRRYRKYIDTFDADL